MNLVYKDGQGRNEAVVYEGARADGLVQKSVRNMGVKAWFIIVTYTS